MQPVGFLVDQFGNPLSGYGQPPSPPMGAGLDHLGYLPDRNSDRTQQGSPHGYGMKGSFNRSGSDRSLRSNQSEDADSCRSRASSASSVGSHMSTSNTGPGSSGFPPGGAASQQGEKGSFNVGLGEGSFVRSPNGSFVRHALRNDYQPHYQPHGAAKGAMGGMGGDGGGLGRGEEEIKDAPVAVNQFRGEGRRHLMVGTRKEAAGAGAAGYV